MYEKVKKVLQSTIPQKYMFRYEEIIRGIYYQFYRGNKAKCNICEKKLKKFITLPSEEKICPNCGSTRRNRRLWEILKLEIKNEEINILHFSPSRCLYRILSKQSLIKYQSTDYVGEFIADKQLDITRIEEPDNICDLIICYHILEHIEDDHKAMKELYRILKNEGKCIVQTPFKEGDIFEDNTKITPEERLKHFGQQDHVRIYSINGLKSRLENIGFKVEVKIFSEKSDNYLGLHEKECVLIANKN